MALEFNCPHCGNFISVQHLRIGETASCPSCKKSAVVPANAVQSGEPSRLLTQVDEKHSPVSAPTNNETRLARRRDRFFAAFLDGIILSILPWISMAFTMPSFFELAQRNPSPEEITFQAFRMMGIILLCQIPGWVFYSYLLTTRGQTPGKIALDIKIVKADTYENGGFNTNVLMRAIVNGFICLVPFYAMVDILFILGDSKRCLHDKLAGTVVIRTDG